jgi:glucose/arabinose dehydrogenase
MLFYTGSMFPEKYKHGAFVAFHGSWNRAPHQEGFYVAFVPFKDGKPNGEWEIFANGFAQNPDPVSPRDAKYRPCGLAQGPDGALYVSDDAHGGIFKITYNKK